MACLALGLLIRSLKTTNPGEAWFPRGEGLRDIAGGARRDRGVRRAAQRARHGHRHRALPRGADLVSGQASLVGDPGDRASARPASTGWCSCTGCACRSPKGSFGFSDAPRDGVRHRADAVQRDDGGRRRAGRHPDRRAARRRAALRRGDAAAAHLRHGPDLRHHHARRALRRHHVRRHDHRGADQHAGRVGLGGHLPRRLPDGAAGARRAGARHRRHRLVHRRHDRRGAADAGVAAAREVVAVLRPARDLRADAARPHHRDAARRRRSAQGLHQHGARA